MLMIYCYLIFAKTFHVTIFKLWITLLIEHDWEYNNSHHSFFKYIIWYSWNPIYTIFPHCTSLLRNNFYSTVGEHPSHHVLYSYAQYVVWFCFQNLHQQSHYWRCPSSLLLALNFVFRMYPFILTSFI